MDSECRLVWLWVLLLGITIACTHEESKTMKSHSRDKTESTAFAEPETTYLGQKAAAMAADKGGESGFLLMDRGRTALAIVPDDAQL